MVQLNPNDRVFLLMYKIMIIKRNNSLLQQLKVTELGVRITKLVPLNTSCPFGIAYLVEIKNFFAESLKNSLKNKLKNKLNSIVRPMNNIKKYNGIHE